MERSKERIILIILFAIGIICAGVAFGLLFSRTVHFSPPECTTHEDCLTDDSCAIFTSCNSGVCEYKWRMCNDNDACTEDSCNSKNGFCQHTEIPSCVA